MSEVERFFGQINSLIEIAILGGIFLTVWAFIVVGVLYLYAWVTGDWCSWNGVGY